MIITISRQAATNAALIAHIVAERLGMRVYDDEIIDEIARLAQTDSTIVQRFDEVLMSPVASILFEWRSSLNEQVYGRHLREVLHRIAEKGNAIIIGRGANFILRQPDVLHVRIVAPLELRVGMYCAGEQVCDADARQWISEHDHRRKQFIQRQFGESIDNPLAYDLVINLALLSLEGTAELIVHAAKLRESEQVPSVAETVMLPKYKETLARHRPVHRPPVVERNGGEPG